MTAVKWPVKKNEEKKIVKMTGMFLGFYYANIFYKIYVYVYIL